MKNILWGLDDDPDGNVQHVAQHGLTKEDVEHVFHHPDSYEYSAQSGNPIVFGYASDGRYIVVVFVEIDDETVYPITAYEVPEPGFQR